MIARFAAVDICGLRAIFRIIKRAGAAAVVRCRSEVQLLKWTGRAMRLQLLLRSLAVLLTPISSALRYDPEEVGFNLNENKTATEPLSYWGEWENHTFYPSPLNWRVPFYTLFLDRFVNGDPANDDANGTQFEHDLTSNRFRHGGDVLGLLDSLDYLQGMGVKVRN